MFRRLINVVQTKQNVYLLFLYREQGLIYLLFIYILFVFKSEEKSDNMQYMEFDNSVAAHLKIKYIYYIVVSC